MDDRNQKGTSRAVVLAAILHLGIVGFLALAVVPCSFFESAFNALHLPASWNPITCTPPIVSLPGEIIEATLVGPTGAPPPKAVQAPVAATPPPTITPPPTPPPPEPVPVKTLPPPPEHPDTVDQEKIVEDAPTKADDAKKAQEEKQRQRAAEMDAQAAKQREEQKKIDDIFAKLDQASKDTNKATSKAAQAKQQMQDLQNAKDDGLPNVPAAAQKQTGTNGPDSGLIGQYIAAIQNAVTPNWQRPDTIPAAPCVVHIVQSPGGDVMSARVVDAKCPYDDAGKRSVENAVLRTNTLPYKGFESVFQREIDFTFRPQ